MFAKLKAFLALLRHGEEVSNVEAWKRRQITAGMLVSLLAAGVALAKSFGIEIDTNNVQLESVALGILSIYGLIDATLTAVTSKRAGVLPEKKSE